MKCFKEIGKQIGYDVGVQLGAYLKQYFARYLNTLPYYSEYLSEDYLRDTTGSGAIAEPTIVWDADGTAKIEFVTAEKAYTLAAVGTTTDNLSTALTISYSVDRYTITTAAKNIHNVKLYDSTYSPTEAEKVDLNLTASQSWVVHQFSCEEGAGDGTTDNTILFDRLNDGVYATLIDITSGAVWSTDSTIPSINNALGYGVSDETAYGDELVVNGDFNDGSTGWTLAAAASVDNESLKYSAASTNIYAYQDLWAANSMDGKTIELSYEVLENSLDVSRFNSGGFSGNEIIDIELPLDSSIGYHHIALLVDGTGNANLIFLWVDSLATSGILRIDNVSIRDTVEDSINLPISTTNKTLTVLGTTPDYLGKAGYDALLTKRNCVLGDGTAKLTFASLPTYDAITIVEDGAETSISLTTLEFTPTNGKYYNNVIFTNASVEVAKFPLNEYDADSSPTSIAFNCVLESSATCTGNDFTTGAGGNLSDCNGLSWNFEKGFATITATGDAVKYPILEDGSGYAGLTGEESGFTAYLPNNNASEQNLKWAEVQEMIERDDSFNDGALPLYVSEVAQDIPTKELVDGGINEPNELKITNGVITSIKLK